ncbi:Sds3-like-domain-containing protein [Tricharina praecox]|uniref:Sds3-like-domain-containing protein n=1 Tax=Tricharina praecox TaxID=43433 RepID=UPI00221F4420|nr:Sds3-like-domain-containing protein [Tricharina praecox]KAI5848990.1 Sds3-like-domain-containing protein [Tricharina praecox]
MAPDAGGPSVKSATIAAGRLESSYQRTASPLSNKVAANAVLSASAQTRTTPTKRRNDFQNDRDSDSSLSDFEVADSDAETERLHISPQKQRPGQMVQHTSSSVVTTETMAFEIPVAKEGIFRPATADTTDDHAVHSSPGTPTRSASKKRKREEISPAPQLLPSEVTENSKSVQPHAPPKKKVYAPDTQQEALGTAKPAASEHKDQHTTANGAPCSPKSAAATNGATGHPLNESTSKAATEGPMDIDQQPDDDAEDEDTDQPPSAPAEEEPGESVDVAPDDDEGAEEEAKKLKAIEDLAEIEKIFAKLKDSIYNDKLQRVEIEMKMLGEGTHPEYVAQKKCIDERLEEKVRLADAQYRYAMESLHTSTKVNRAQVHSQYFQQTRQLREESLYNCSELWYEIQRERRASEALVPEYTFRIPDRQSTRVKQRMQYNWEVTLLQGIQQHIGFPAAPDVDGATEDEKAEDLEALGINPRAVAARSVAPPSVMRMDDIAPHNWVHAHSPPSPVIHTAASQQMQQQTHPATAGTHIHHHHHRHRHSAQQGFQRPQQHQQEQQQTNYSAPPPPQPSRRGPSSSNLGPPPSSSASLASLLHPPQPESSVKMEAQASQTSLPPFKNTEAFSNFSSHPQQQQRQSPYSMAHIQHPFGRTTGNEHQQHVPYRLEGGRSPTPGERMHRMKEELSQTTERMRGSLYRPGGGGLGYS